MRGFASGVSATANWLTNAAVAQTFLVLTGAFGGSGTFWLYAAIAAAGAVWAHFTVVETQGASFSLSRSALAFLGLPSLAIIGNLIEFAIPPALS